jgi:hypothetical protein
MLASSKSTTPAWDGLNMRLANTKRPSKRFGKRCNGAFTKALVEGLDGKADLLHNGTITLSELDAYVLNRVKELTEGQQHAVMSRPSTVSDYPIAVTSQ